MIHSFSHNIPAIFFVCSPYVRHISEKVARAMLAMEIRFVFQNGSPPFSKTNQRPKWEILDALE